MSTSRTLALLLSCSLLGAGAVATAPTASAAPGWTTIVSDYPTDASTPRFRWCEVGETDTKVTLKVKAIRPDAGVNFYAVFWSKHRDHSEPSGTAGSDAWRGNLSVVRFTIPRSSFLSISYQRGSTGGGFTATRRTPLDLRPCP